MYIYICEYLYTYILTKDLGSNSPRFSDSVFPERVGGPARGPLRRLPLGDRGHLRTGLCRLRVNLLWEKPCLALVWNSLAWWHLQHLAGCSSHFSSWCFTVLYLVVLICFALVPALQFHFRTFWGCDFIAGVFPRQFTNAPLDLLALQWPTLFILFGLY